MTDYRDTKHLEALEPDLLNEGSHPAATTRMSAEEALERLKGGNAAYCESHLNTGDISPELVKRLADEGQAPFACVVACADSRVVPEHIFMTGLGELFCVRVAGNVVEPTQLASCVYAVEHLGCKLVVVLGHTHCGAIEAAMAGEDAEGPVAPLLGPIRQAIRDERDPYEASVLNVRAGVEALLANDEIVHLQDEGLRVIGAVYHTHTGVVDFLS